MKKELIDFLVKIFLLSELCFILFLWITRYQLASASGFKMVDTGGAITIAENNPAGIENKKIGGEKSYKSSEKICTEVKNAKTCSNRCSQFLAEENNIRKEIEANLENKIFYKQPVLATGKVAGVAIYVPRKLSCPEKNYGHPSKSDTKGKHTDEDCCPDPDEWPKPGCVYDAKGYSIMLSGPAKK